MAIKNKVVFFEDKHLYIDILLTHMRTLKVIYNSSLSIILINHKLYHLIYNKCYTSFL